MATAARLTIPVWRNDDVYEFPLRVRGADLTNAALAMEVRREPDSPGLPLATFAKVSDPAVLGLRVAAVTVVDGMIVSDVRIQLSKAMRQALPYSAVMGEAKTVAYALLIDGRTRLHGDIEVLANAYGSDAAPTNRAIGASGLAGRAPSGGATLTISEDGGATITLDGADLVGAIALRLEGYRDEALDARDEANEIVATLGGPDTGWPRGPHAWWRILVIDPSTGSDMRFQEVEFRAAPGGPSQTTGGSAFGSVSAGGPYTEDKAFDAIPGAEFITYAAPAYIGYHFAAPRSVGEVSLLKPQGTPIVAFSVQYSDDSTTGADGTWTTAWSVAGITGWGSGPKLFADPQFGQLTLKPVLGSSSGGGLFVREGGVNVAVPVASEEGSGLSAFQKVMIPAMQRGRLPRFSPVNPALPALVKSGSGGGAVPGGDYLTAISWNSPLLRWEGGQVQALGGNDFSTVRTYNSNGYSAGLTGDDKYCNASRVEWMFDGSSLMLGLIGGGGPFRILVDDAYIEVGGGKTYGFDVFPPDGGLHVFRLDLGSAAMRRIMLDASGPIRLHAIWVPARATISAPADAPRPVVYLDGPSIVEAGHGWANSFTRLMGVDSWNAGVGATGVFNPGPNGSGRANMRARANWLHRRFEFGLHQGLINDGDDAFLGSDGSYADRFRRYADQYRFILEDWPAEQNARPWFSLGFLPNTPLKDSDLPSIYWAIRDATDQVCGEFNQFAAFIDPLPSAGFLPGNGVEAAPQSYYLTPPDPTHPNAEGSAMLGRRIARQVGDLIRGGRF